MILSSFGVIGALTQDNFSSSSDWTVYSSVTINTIGQYAYPTAGTDIALVYHNINSTDDIFFGKLTVTSSGVDYQKFGAMTIIQPENHKEAYIIDIKKLNNDIAITEKDDAGNSIYTAITVISPISDEYCFKIIVNETKGALYYYKTCDVALAITDTGWASLYDSTAGGNNNGRLRGDNQTRAFFGWRLANSDQHADGIAYYSTNQVPTLTSPEPTSDQTIAEPNDYTFNITIADLDNNVTYTTWYVNSTNITSFYNYSTYNFTGNYSCNGTYNITVETTDSKNSTFYQYNLTVTHTNRQPSISQPELNDSDPTTNMHINCSNGTFSDSDSEDSEVSREFRWYENDVEIIGETNETLDLSNAGFDYTDVFLCEIRVYDGTIWSNYTNSSNSANISNSLPTTGLSNITTNSSSNYAGETYNLINLGPYNDADGHSASSYEYQWRNGTTDITGETTTTLDCSSYSTSYCAKEQLVNLMVRVSDGINWSIFTRSSNISIDNKPPTASSADLNPDNPVITDDLNCSNYTYTDIDSDLENETIYRWFNNSIEVTELENFSIIDSGNISASETWTCEITPHDGTDYGTPVNTSETIASTAPSINTYNTSTSHISPANVGTNVTFDVAWSDIDSTGVNMFVCNSSSINNVTGCVDRTYCNTSNSTNNPQQCNYTVLTQDSTNSSYYVMICDDDYQCVNDTGTFYVNHAPSISIYNITPSTAYTNETLTCNYDFTDSDNDADSSHFNWSQYNTAHWSYVGIDSSTLPTTNTTKEYSYICEITPQDDNSFNGTIYNTTNVTILNSIPYLTGQLISPSTPEGTDDLVCEYNYYDTDIDAEDSVEFRWYLNQTLNQTTTTNLSSDNTTFGNEWICEVRVNDSTDYSVWYNSSSVFINDTVSPLIDDAYFSTSTTTTNADIYFYVNVSDASSNVTEVNISFSDPNSIIFTNVALSEYSTGKWRRQWTVGTAGNWTFLNTSIVDYANNTNSSDVNEILIVTVPSGDTAGGGASSPPVTIIEESYIDFCGDGVCNGNETPANCWQDCSVNIDNIVTCLFTDPKSCIYSESWFATIMIYFLVGIGIFFAYKIESQKRKKKKKPKHLNNRKN